MTLELKEYLFGVGLLLLVIALALDWYIPDYTGILAFVKGLMLGLSAVLNLAGIYYLSRRKS